MVTSLSAEPVALWAASLTASIVATVAWRLRTLTAPGAGAAAIVGGAVLWGTGWGGGIVLATFFLTSIAVSHAFPPEEHGHRFHGARRNVWQVAANGGAAALGGVIGVAHAGLGLWIVTAALAGAAADTWATEIGKARGGTPRDLLTGEPVPAGTSGGITRAGTLAGAAGAVVIGLVAGAVTGWPALTVAAIVIGFGSMMADSALGAAWQVRYLCPACQMECEDPRHRCGVTGEYHKGIPWLDNNTVNAVTTTFAAGAGGLWWLLACAVF
jgi:uncharacterized protein (TIGR00297 family)